MRLGRFILITFTKLNWKIIHYILFVGPNIAEFNTIRKVVSKYTISI